MHKYDTVLKSLLQGSQSSLLQQIAGAKIRNWLNVELPNVTQLRVDLLGRTASNRLIGFELQSFNDPDLPIRMAEYSLHVYRLYRQFPEQYVIYVGNARMSMPAQLVGPAFQCQFHLIDIRDFSEDALLNSPYRGDHILAILAKHPSRVKSIRRILSKIATLESAARRSALKELFILSGLRKLGKEVRAEVKQMPILEDITTHDLLGPIIRKSRKEGLQEGRQEGRQEGLQEGRQEGLQKGELAIVRRLIAKRFGPLPLPFEKRLTNFSLPELEALSLRLLDAKSIEDLFARRSRNPSSKNKSGAK